MGSPEKAQDKFEEYLQKLEARERRQRRKRWLRMLPWIGVGLIALGVWALGQRNQVPRQDMHMYQAHELNPDQLSQVFHADNAAIVVDHPLLGQDTMLSEAEYGNWVDLVNRIEDDRRVLTQEGEVQDSVRATAAGTLPVYMVDIAGERRVGVSLTFTIEDYDEEVQYLLDFGNGITREVKNRTVYRYPLPGHFVLQLVATHPDRGSSVYTKKYEIKPRVPVSVATENEPVL